MSDPHWRVADPSPDDAAPGAATALVSLHFLQGALRRRWRTWVSMALVGALLGIAWTMLVPAQKGTVTLLLAHDPSANPDQALATDVSLLRTRTVAGMVIEELDLDVSPASFQQSLVVNPLSSSVIVIEVDAPDRPSAVRRAKAVSDAFLAFRTEQIDTQSRALIDGYETRMTALQLELDKLTKQYDVLSSGGPANQEKAGNVLARRSQVSTEINNVQQVIQDTRLTSNSVIAATHVLDPPSAMPSAGLMRLFLVVGSGLVGGAAVGAGLVIFTALSSDRLRRREEVAVALGASVRLSVRTPRGRRSWIGRRRRDAPSPQDLDVLGCGIESALTLRKNLSRKAKPTRLALAAVDNVEAVVPVVAHLAAHFTRTHVSAFLVDLSASGGLESAVTSALESHGEADPAAAPVVFRPDGVPSLARGPVGAAAAKTTGALPETDPRRSAWDRADVILTLAEVDPAVGVDHLRTWADQVVVMVSAGRSSAERLRTTGDLLRSAGLKLPFAVMLGADRHDESSGVPESFESKAPGARRTS